MAELVDVEHPQHPGRLRQDLRRQAVPAVAEPDNNLCGGELSGALNDAAVAVSASAELPPERESFPRSSSASAVPVTHAPMIAITNMASSDRRPSRSAGTGSPLRVTFQSSSTPANDSTMALMIGIAAFMSTSPSVSWLYFSATSSSRPSGAESIVTSRPSYLVPAKSSFWPVPETSKPPISSRSLS
jgi:hypothetical protein